MKKVIVFIFALILVACSTDNKQEETLRARAIEDIMAKLELPEGTQFNDENIEVSEKSTDVEGIDALYVVKVTVKSQDKEGNEVLKTYTLNYEKIGEGGLDPHDYELKSFE